MKILLLLLLTFTISFAMTLKCELATNQAVNIHVKYMNNKATLTDSYNAMNKMKKSCKGQ